MHQFLDDLRSDMQYLRNLHVFFFIGQKVLQSIKWYLSNRYLYFMTPSGDVRRTMIQSTTYMRRNVWILDLLWSSLNKKSIENIWTILTREVYKTAKHYDSTMELKKAIQKAWYFFKTTIFQKLIDFKRNTVIWSYSKP